MMVLPGGIRIDFSTDTSPNRTDLHSTLFMIVFNW
jgi:hypothetical protein